VLEQVAVAPPPADGAQLAQAPGCPVQHVPRNAHDFIMAQQSQRTWGTACEGMLGMGGAEPGSAEASGP
jgi:hypothetical protein